MIDLRLTEIGGAEVARRLAGADGEIRQALREELAEVGDEIVSRAQAFAPKATGFMASKIIWFFGQRRERGRGAQRRLVVVESASKRQPGKIEFSAMPTGRVAHLVERGVNASFYQRTGQRGANAVGSQGPGRGRQGPAIVREGPTYRYPRTLSIRPRPFFMPAVESVGGASGVNARLQGALDRVAKEGA